MFEVGQKVVCISDNPYIIFKLQAGKIYEIKSKAPSNDLVELKEHPFNAINSNKFLSIPDYRRLKIQKIKERICSK